MQLPGALEGWCVALGLLAHYLGIHPVIGVALAFLLRWRWKSQRRRLAAVDSLWASPLPPGLDIDGVERHLEERDAAEGPQKPGTGSAVHWAVGPGIATELAFVYIHGWSASCEEIDPVDLKIAQAFGCNLLRFRLTAHGLSPVERGAEAMRTQPTMKALQLDAATAFACGRLLGKRVVVIGTSTGATLSLWLATQAFAAERLAALVLFSPGFAIKKAGARTYQILKRVILVLPWVASAALLHLVAGKFNRPRGGTTPRSVEDFNRIWTTCYPTESESPHRAEPRPRASPNTARPAPQVIHVIELYVALEAVRMSDVPCPVLVLGNPDDRTVDFQACASLTPRAQLPAPRPAPRPAPCPAHPRRVDGPIARGLRSRLDWVCPAGRAGVRRARD